MNNDEEKNLDKRLANLRPKQFTSEYQPSPEAKKKGWNKRRIRQQILDMTDGLINLSVKQLEDLKEDIKNNPDKHKVLEKMLTPYVSKEKFVIDFLDRNIGKATQDIDIKGNIGLTVKDVVKELKELDNEPID